MKKLMLKIISTILLLVLSTIAFSSCFSWGKIPNKYPSLYPEGYTCGFGLQPGSPLEYWWVETYDECVEAIKLLRNNGSTFSDAKIFTYEGDLFDTKYCFVFSREKDEIKFGDNPFDRYAEEVIIIVYAFFDDVSIDEINYSLVSQYHAYVYGAREIYKENYESTPVDQLVIGDWELDNYKYYKKVYYNDSVVIGIRTCFYATNANETGNLKMTDEIIKELIISGKMIKTFET